jgi:hypothetical protein
MPINGTPDDDELRGTAAPDEINGGDGDDTILGRAGDDVLNGDDGDDQIDGGAGNDEINGGDGDDTLEGKAGEDTIDGGEGDDAIYGGAGTDSLTGGAGDDYISGGSGADTITGGAGDDALEGGAGADRYVFEGDFGTDTILDFANADRIDLTAYTSYSIEQDGDDVLIHAGTGTIIVKDATVQQVAARVEVACLVRGTLVRTPNGETAVETLSIGDEVLTVDGTAVPVKWIGRRAYSKSFLDANENIVPVEIGAGALGGNMPARALRVSPEHAVLVGDVLVPAGLLVDGAGIRRARGLESVEYFHLEFDDPQVIVTNGAATESYVELGNRRMFANYAEYTELYGEDGSDRPRQRRFELVDQGPGLERVRARLPGATARAA